MNKHTPGPWVYDGGGHFYAACQLDECGLTRRLDGHRMPYEMPIAEMGDGRLENYKANARLIAAAPELLDALRGLVDWFDDETKTPRPAPLKKAYAAIAKAEEKNT